MNNCAKRILEDLYKQMTADPGSTVVLVGHEDEREARGSAAPRPSPGREEHRGNLDCWYRLSSEAVQVAWVGTKQDAEFKTRSCETSVVERKGQTAGSDAEAKNRRVEIRIVPKGVAMPAAAVSIARVARWSGRSPCAVCYDAQPATPQ